MLLLDDLSKRWQIDDPEEQRAIADVSLAQYETLLAERGDSLAYRVHYLDGALTRSIFQRAQLRSASQNMGGSEPDDSYCKSISAEPLRSPESVLQEARDPTGMAYLPSGVKRLPIAAHLTDWSPFAAVP